MKNKILCLLFVQIIIQSCSKPSPSKAVITLPYVISLEDSLLKIKEYKKGVPPPPPIQKYAFGDMNFVLGDSNEIFYHGKHIFRMCGTGLDESKADFLNLGRYDLVRVDESIVKQLITDNLQYSEYRFVVVSSKSDTINSPVLETIVSTTKQNKAVYFIRRISQEENDVLNDKKAFENYRRR